MKYTFILSASLFLGGTAYASPAFDTISSAVNNISQNKSSEAEPSDCKRIKGETCRGSRMSQTYATKSDMALADIEKTIVTACESSGGDIGFQPLPQNMKGLKSPSDRLGKLLKQHAQPDPGIYGVCKVKAADDTLIVIKNPGQGNAAAINDDDLDDDSYTIYINSIQENNG